jgi:hypothetical protein
MLYLLWRRTDHGRGYTLSSIRSSIYFGSTGLGRFDDREGGYGVLYVAGDPFGAFV